MKRPLLIIAISYIIGIIIGVYLKISIPIIILIFIIINIINISLSIKKGNENKLEKDNKRNKKTNNYKNVFQNKKVKIILITSFVICISNIKLNILNKRYSDFYQLNKKEITLIGTICEDIKETEYKYITVIKLKGKYKNIKININIKKDLLKYKKINYGNEIQIKGIYIKPEGRRNYKGFSYEEYLRTKGIYGNINVDKNIKVLKNRDLNIFLIMINNLSKKMKSNLDKLLNKQNSGLAKGILLGDNFYLDDKIKESFKECNLSHMLAVSGAHLSYLIIGINLIFNKKIFGIRNSNILCIMIIIVFMIITNMTPSVSRAGMMVIISIVARLIYRKQDIYVTMSIALLITLLINPYSLFNIGLQLSYLATLSIIIFYPMLEDLIKNIKDKNIKIKNVKLKNSILNKLIIYIKESSLVSISANILILPIIMYKFNVIPINFLISNLCVGPFLGIAIILGFFIIIISCISINIAKIFSFFLNLLLSLIVNLTKIISNIKNITIITPYFLTITIVYIIIGIIITCYKKKINIKNHIKKFINLNKRNNFKKIISIFMIIVLLLIVPLKIKINSCLLFYLIDIGQGDGMLIKTPKGKNILIDGGGSYSDKDKGVGEKILLPYLLNRRVKKLDYIILSHFDIDHVGAAMEIMQKIKVDKILIGKQYEECSNFNKFEKIVKDKKLKVYIVKKGDKIIIEDNVRIDILWPVENDLIEEKALNNNSIVCKLIYNKNSILLTGDIEKIAEEEILDIYDKNNKLKSDILKIAHHGSKSSSIKEFLKEVSPKIALIGVGKDNKFGHPSEITIEKLKKMNIKIYRTDINGEVEIKIRNDGRIRIKD